MAESTRVARIRVKEKGTNNYVRILSEPEHDAASRARRVRNWMPGISSPNSHVWSGLTTIRARSRDLTRKIPLIAGAYHTIAANIIGDGIKPLSRSTDEAFRKSVMEVWQVFKDECDADHVLDYDGLCALMVRGMWEAGEVFVRFRRRQSSDGYMVPLQLQVLESEMVPEWKNELLPNGNQVIAGIEFDGRGRRVAYHIFRTHPGETMLMRGSDETTRVPAADVMHVYEVLRPGQVRGLPRATSALLRSRDWMTYDEAELVRKQIAAMFAGFITRPAEDNTVNEDADDPEASDGVALAALEPGTLQLLDAGEEITFSDPKDSGPNYEPYRKGIIRDIAAGFGLTYHQFSGDLRDVNFSSARVGLNEFQRRARRTQRDFIFQSPRLVWQRMIREAVLVGALAAPGFGFEPRKFTAVRWVPPGWRYVNPREEIIADKEAIKAGIKSRFSVAAERGDDVEEITRQVAEDKELADEFGVSFDVDVNGSGGGGATPPGEDGSDEGQPGDPNEPKEPGAK